MPRILSSPQSSDSEDAAPEVLTLSSTKKASRTRAKAVHAFEAAQKEKRKRENRERDAALKMARAVREEDRRTREKRDEKKAKGKRKSEQSEGKGKAKEALNAEERMERAMREAAEEDGSDFEEDGREGDEEEDWSGVEGSDMDAEDSAAATSNHLPDHLFSAVPPRLPSPKYTTTLESVPKSRKKKHKKSKAKELIVGSRTLRTIPSSHPDALTASLTLPPARVNKFLKRTLNLRKGGGDSGGSSKQGGRDAGSKQGGGANGKGKAKPWERRPVNVGVMRTTGGPALRFVRGA